MNDSIFFKAAIPAAALLLLGVAAVRHTGRASVAALLHAVSRHDQTVPPTVIGMNLGELAYWDSGWPFTDIVQSTGRPLYGWANITNQVPMDIGGHPKAVPAGTLLHIIIQHESPRLMMGQFHCHVSPGWDVTPFGDWTMEGGPRDFQMKVVKAQSRTGIILTLVARSPHADLSEFSCKPVHQAPEELFNPAFLVDHQPYRVIRFMDWMHTNNAPHREWASRATPGSFSQAGGPGASLEDMVALANSLHADPWFNLPFDTDPTYYREFATYVRDHLARDRKAYVELSNEVWNTGFKQGKDATRLGLARYLDASAELANDWYYGDRVRDLMTTWNDVYRGQEKRIVRVLSSQQGNPRRAEQALSHNDTWRSVDALATSAYFGTWIGQFPQAGGSRLDAVFASGPKLIDQVMATAHSNKDIAANYHLRYIAYEGGPGFEAYQPDLKADVLKLQYDPRIFNLYTQFLKRWQAEIGDVFVAFNGVSTTFWGHMQYTGQPLSDAPKARALAEFGQRK